MTDTNYIDTKNDTFILSHNFDRLTFNDDKITNSRQFISDIDKDITSDKSKRDYSSPLITYDDKEFSSIQLLLKYDELCSDMAKHKIIKDFHYSYADFFMWEKHIPTIEGGYTKYNTYHIIPTKKE